MLELVIMIVGFTIAAYAIVANDAIQTLGTFIASNSNKPWWVLWLFSASVLVSVLFFGWYTSGIGDPSYGRLESIPMPEGGLTWMFLVPPIVVLLLTRYSIPVSTTFLVLTFFAPKNLDAMLIKSLMGYAVAFFTAIILYRFVIRRTTEYFNKTSHLPTPAYWVGLQWVATTFLWSQWLIQDLANIFVYLPRSVGIEWITFAVFVFVSMLGVIFYRQGGAIQRIVNEKTGTTDIRAATIIDFIYGLILLVFKEWSNIPMSTTWVFLGLLAGREFAISMHMYTPPMNQTARVVAKDAGRAFLGLAISVALALGLPMIYAFVSG